METKNFTKIGLVMLLALLSFACSENKNETAFERDNMPWVFRSVLDEKPRMVTMALQEDLWVAYSTEYGSIYKAWKGGVNFDGAVYTTRHGPQPNSEGGDYFVSSFDQPWVIIKDGKTTPAKIQYKGHEFYRHQVKLKYELKVGKQVVKIEETPEFIRQESDRPGLERVFITSDVPDGVTIGLKTNLGSILSEKSYSVTGGELMVEKESSEAILGTKVMKLEGLLKLKSNGQTTFRAFFYPEALQEETQTVAVADMSPTQLIEGSDCNSCHNVVEKTIGPSFTTIAEKYESNLSNVEYLANKIIQGGSGVWGETVMNAHPDMPYDQASKIARYVLSLDKEEGEIEAASDEAKGVVVNVYQYFEPLNRIPEIEADQLPVVSKQHGMTVINTSLVNPMRDRFLAVTTGYLKIERTNNYVFRTRNSNGGSRFTLDGRVLIDFDGVHEGGWVASPDAEIELKAGIYPFKFEYFRSHSDPGENGDKWYGVLRWKPFGADQFDIIPSEFLTYDNGDLESQTEKAVLTYTGPKIPGDKLPLAGVHPSFDLSQARPDGFEPRVGGMDFLSDGRLVISTWDSLGAVYLLENVETGDPSQIKTKRIATGLAEPLGLKVVDDEIYVLQKQELTKLIDHDNDEIIDEYQTVCNGWRVSNNFHEFAFGLEYKDGHFYGALAVAILPGGASAQPQIPDRGKVIKINKETGAYELIAHGLRTPNGNGIGVDGELFNCDNQGDWLPACKVVHVEEGDFFGSRAVDFEGTKDLKMKPPVVWMPQDEIGNSPSEIGLLQDGPYRGQMMVGEVTNGGLKRIFVEKIGGEYQGALFRFTQGIEAGVNRFAWGPDGALYVGCIGVSGNWGHYVNGEMGKFGLQRLKFNEKSTFEMLAVRAKSNGMEIEFTEPIEAGAGLTPESYEVSQWWYLPTEEYGGPKMDQEALPIKSVHIAEDRKKVFLELEGMKPEHVVYIRLKDHFLSESGQGLWSTECWYTLNQIPKNRPGFERQAQVETKDNELTAAEQAAGWKLLFDGESTQGWRNYNAASISSAWTAQNGTLTFNPQVPEGGDIITDEEYQNFELSLEWKISENGNSGIFFNVVEDKKYDAVYLTGPEMQVLDNAGHPDARIPKHQAGDLYDLISCRYITVKPAGEWNQARLIVNKGKVEHWLNGHRVVEYELWTDNWKQMVANSKFKEMPDFGKAKKGHIALQDHDDRVWYKNIKIRKL